MHFTGSFPLSPLPSSIMPDSSLPVLMPVRLENRAKVVPTPDRLRKIPPDSRMWYSTNIFYETGGIPMLEDIKSFINWVRNRNPEARTWKDYGYDLRFFARVVGE